MNIEIANRLFELRKQKNFSQEELAEKIGVSRQAVSKWERAESSPDTNNLIELARLYEVSLDELLSTDEPIFRKASEENPEFVSVGLDGVHVIEKDGSEVHVSWKGIKVKNANNPDFDENIDQTWDEIGERVRIKTLLKLPAPIIVAAIYLIIGFTYNLWHPGWIIFFIIPIYYQIIAMCTAKSLQKKLNLFPASLLCAVLYLFAGFCCNLWHPAWILFFVIPI